MKRSEKDLALSVMDAYNRAVTYQLPRTVDALRLALNVIMIEMREREEAEIIAEARGAEITAEIIGLHYYDANGDLIR